MTTGKVWAARRALACLVAAMVFGWAGVASALGSVRTDKSAYEEKDGVWKVKFTIDYGRKPDLPHVPMTFSFKQVMIYKRVLTDEGGDEPQLRKERVDRATPINVPMDVGFADASGTMYKVTKFKIKLRRDNDFEAGEYELKVKTSNGTSVGRPLRLRLNGKNKAIDYRSLDFGASRPKPKAAADPGPPAEAGDDEADEGGAVEDMGPDLSDIPDVDDSELDEPDAPPAVAPKQGGCGCRVAGTRVIDKNAPEGVPPSWPHGPVAIVALTLGVVGRRRRRQHPPRGAGRP
ncbi:MAG: hypothetical protein AAGN82_15095 [Myxococcota bacterium]